MQPPDGHRLDPVFFPDSIAIVGASTNPRSPGYRYVKVTVDRGVDPVYPINPNADTVYGLPAFDDVTSLPGPVDLAIVLVPAPKVPSILRECAAAGIPAVHVGSSGFSEAGTAAGDALAAQLDRVVDDTGLTVVGPNCMGIHSPRANLSYLSVAPESTGSVAFISHSGGFTLDLLAAGRAYGIDFSLGASIGNELDVTLAECLAYALDDEATEVVGLYVEGVPSRAEGDRLFEVLASAEKPVVAIKGGRTDRGTEAAASHTGALAGSDRVWQAIFEQTGTVTVDSLDAMRDLCTLLPAVDRVEGNATALVGPGGGTTVMAIDACSRAGIDVPTFTEATVEVLRAVDVPSAGNLDNPVDVPFSALFLEGGDTFEAIIETVTADPTIDSVVVHVNATHFTYDTIDGAAAFETMVSAVLAAAVDVEVPLLLVFRNVDAVPSLYERSLALRDRCQRAGVPVFGRMDAAVWALGALVDRSGGGPDGA